MAPPQYSIRLCSIEIRPNSGFISSKPWLPGPYRETSGWMVGSTSLNPAGNPLSVESQALICCPGRDARPLYITRLASRGRGTSLRPSLRTSTSCSVGWVCVAKPPGSVGHPGISDCHHRALTEMERKNYHVCENAYRCAHMGFMGLFYVQNAHFLNTALFFHGE